MFPCCEFKIGMSFLCDDVRCDHRELGRAVRGLWIGSCRIMERRKILRSGFGGFERWDGE